MSIAYTYQKPLPDESIYKHLHMLHNYLTEQAANEFMDVRKAAFMKAAEQIARVAEGRAVRQLQEFGE